VRFVISRPTRVLATLATAGLLLAGCGSGLSQVGAAAIVGDTRIPVTDVQSWFNAVLHKEAALKPQLQKQGQMDELGREIASFEVQQELIRQTARDEHLSVDEKRIDDAINRLGGPQAATAGKIYTPENFREAARSQLLAAELGRKYLDRLAVTFDFTQASTRQEAETKARRMAQSPQEAAALVDADRKAGVPASADEKLRAADSIQVAADGTQLATDTPLFGAAPGTVVAFTPPDQPAQWLVVRIKGRDTNSPSAAPIAAQTDEGTLQKFGMRLLAITADRVGVRLSPRYGVWDPIALGAAPSAGETTGFRFTGPKAPSA
jgi:hypothetical protein